MAYNFLLKLPGYKAIRRQRRLYDTIVLRMDPEYRLSVSDGPEIACACNTTTQIVYHTEAIIRSVFLMYQKDREKELEVRKRAKNGDDRAQRVLALYDETLTWDDICTSTTKVAYQAKHSLADAVQALETQLAKSEERVRAQEKLIEELHALLNATDSAYAQLRTEHESMLRRLRNDLTVVQPLPEVEIKNFALMFGLPAEITYGTQFTHAFRRLDSKVKEKATRLLRDLVGHVIPHFKRLRNKRSYAPSGARVSEVTDNCRLVWTMSGNGAIIVHFIGTHKEVWPNSEA